jgi:hypothetical protein
MKRPDYKENQKRDKIWDGIDEMLGEESVCKKSFNIPDLKMFVIFCIILQ